ncbi:MAG TPA: HemK/PrmC family methyltransferase [Clostridia bacterium]|nr:HemK/PrmC family methyltransferase [Clostridia bacterium]
MKQDTVRDLAQRGFTRLRQAGVDSPRLDAELLLAKVLGKDRFFLHLNPDLCPGDGAVKEYFALVERRAAGEPAQYLTGVQEFMGLEFAVNPSVLIPRPDTETLVEAVLERLEARRKTRSLQSTAAAAGRGPVPGVICGSQAASGPWAGGRREGAAANGNVPAVLALDLGTGSGAIAVSLAYYCKRLSVKAVDISAEALRLARENALRHGVADRVEFIQGDLFSPFEGTGIKFDLIVSNPPYISGEGMERLQREVRHEPPHALHGGIDGLDFYKRIAADSSRHIIRGGLLAVEIGHDQAEAVQSILEQTGAYTGIELVKDLAGRDRVVLGTAL